MVVPQPLQTSVLPVPLVPPAQFSHKRGHRDTWDTIKGAIIVTCMKGLPMIHAYRLVYSLSEHAPPQLWEYEQPYINNLLWNARTFERWVVQWYFESWEALDR